MNIRSKIVLVVLPLVIAPLVLVGTISSLSARNGITTVATQFLRFKADQVAAYAEGQWSLLEENDMTGNPAFVEAAISAIGSFSDSVVRSETELILALDAEDGIALSTKSIEFEEGELAALKTALAADLSGWISFSLGGVDRIAHLVEFAALEWRIFVSEERETFYRATQQIVYQMVIILAVAILLSLLLLYLFASYLTRPLRHVVDVMTDIISTSDMSKRVEVLYSDEIGKLGHTFNLMVSELGNAYEHIKGYALRAAVAQSREQKVRNIFQKFVPKDVIEQFFANPEAMLVGENRVLSLMFTDVRSFTTISESMNPDELVESLNQYFTIMVDIVMKRSGIVDKYIGDGLMAFFGAPVRHDDDALQSVLAGLEMLDRLGEFNRWQAERGRPPFEIGVGINYGAVTVGNIGSEKKMDYTVVGDMVNLASRLEGLCKKYPVSLIISESVEAKVKNFVACRLLDRVVVKGRTTGVGIYGVSMEIDSKTKKAWKEHHDGMRLYYQKDFDAAAKRFSAVAEILPEDTLALTMIDRCLAYAEIPPLKSWTGVVEMDEK